MFLWQHASKHPVTRRAESSEKLYDYLAFTLTFVLRLFFAGFLTAFFLPAAKPSLYALAIAFFNADLWSFFNLTIFDFNALAAAPAFLAPAFFATFLRTTIVISLLSW